MASSTMEEDTTPPSLELYPCPICGRTFLPAPLRKHAKVCERNATRKRKVFNSLKQRVEGTDLEPFIQPTFLRKVETISPYAPPGQQCTNRNQSKWKAKHKEFVLAIKEAKGEREMAPRRSISAVGKMGITERCPSCDRKFGPKSFDRHVEWCKEHKNLTIKSPANVLVAKERLEARTKYRVPPLNKSKRSITRDKYAPSMSRTDSVGSVRSLTNFDRSPSMRKSKNVTPVKNTKHKSPPLADKRETCEKMNSSVIKRKIPPPKIRAHRTLPSFTITELPTPKSPQRKRLTWRETVVVPKSEHMLHAKAKLNAKNGATNININKNSKGNDKEQMKTIPLTVITTDNFIQTSLDCGGHDNVVSEYMETAITEMNKNMDPDMFVELLNRTEKELKKTNNSFKSSKSFSKEHDHTNLKDVLIIKEPSNMYELDSLNSNSDKKFDRNINESDINNIEIVKATDRYFSSGSDMPYCDLDRNIEHVPEEEIHTENSKEEDILCNLEDKEFLNSLRFKSNMSEMFCTSAKNKFTSTPIHRPNSPDYSPLIMRCEPREEDKNTSFETSGISKLNKNNDTCGSDENLNSYFTNKFVKECALTRKRHAYENVAYEINYSSDNEFISELNTSCLNKNMDVSKSVAQDKDSSHKNTQCNKPSIILNAQNQFPHFETEILCQVPSDDMLENIQDKNDDYQVEVQIITSQSKEGENSPVPSLNLYRSNCSEIVIEQNCLETLNELLYRNEIKSWNIIFVQDQKSRKENKFNPVYKCSRSQYKLAQWKQNRMRKMLEKELKDYIKQLRTEHFDYKRKRSSLKRKNSFYYYSKKHRKRVFIPRENIENADLKQLNLPFVKSRASSYKKNKNYHNIRVASPRNFPKIETVCVENDKGLKLPFIKSTIRCSSAKKKNFWEQVANSKDLFSHMENHPNLFIGNKGRNFKDIKNTNIYTSFRKQVDSRNVSAESKNSSNIYQSVPNNSPNTSSSKEEYNPFVLAEKQLMDLLQCDDFKAFNTPKTEQRSATSKSKSIPAIKSSNLNPKTNPTKRSSIIDPPNDFQDTSHLPDNFEIIENFINDNFVKNQNYDNRTVRVKNTNISKNNNKNKTIDTTLSLNSILSERKYSDEVNIIDPILINETDNLAIPDKLPLDNDSPISTDLDHYSVQYDKKISALEPLVLPKTESNLQRSISANTEDTIDDIDFDEFISSFDDDESFPTLKSFLQISKTEQKTIQKSTVSLNSSFGHSTPLRSPDKKILSPLKRSVSLSHPTVKARSMKNKHDIQDYLHVKEVKPQKIEPNVPRLINSKIAEMFGSEHKEYDDYKKYDEIFRLDKKDLMSEQRKACGDVEFDEVSSNEDNHVNRRPQIGKFNGDSAYGRHSPKIQPRTTSKHGQLTHIQRPAVERSPSSSGSETSVTHPTKAKSPHRMPKFCHECGNKYPVNTAKFCVECGIKRLIL